MAKHDHRQSLWIIAGGHILWCYRCGAWRMNRPGREAWNKPTGMSGSNPAVSNKRPVAEEGGERG